MTRENSPLHCCNCLSCAQIGVRSGVAVQDDLIYVSVWPNPSNSFFFLTSLMSARIAVN
jgi:hypothetical protein